MMGNWAYNDKYTTLMDKFKRRRHSVCDWVKNNRHKWDHFTYTGANNTRCLNETNYRIDGNGRYSPGIPCSGHGACYEDKTRDFTRTPYADPTKQGGSNIAGEAGEEEEAVDPKLIAAHEAAGGPVKCSFHKQVCPTAHRI